MNVDTLDVIVRRALLEKGFPIHYYCEFLFHGATCLRELTFDTLQVINAANLPVDSTGAINLPDDFTDDLSVCIPAGQQLIPLAKQDWITPLRIHDSVTGQNVPYSDQSNVNNGQTFFGFPVYGWSWFWNVDSFGFPTGGMYGAAGGTHSGYKLLRERRQIQLSEDFIGSNVVLLYISNGQSVDNASQITPMAHSTITAFIHWKRSPNAHNEYSPEARSYYNQRRLLRARLNDLTPTDIRNIIHESYQATIKN